MAKREVTVVINGEEYVSKAAGDAEGALGGFTSKIPVWAKTVAVMAVAFEAVSKAVGMAKDFVLDSFAAYDAYKASQSRLSAQSKLTGVSIGELSDAAKRARDEFGLGTVVANDAAVTTAKYAARAGDATKQNQLLAAALNLGAASGLDAAQSMEALEMGLRGQDEGFDKLLGKNPSTIWKEYADANGLAVGKMTDTQKRMAELTAVVEAGNKVGNVYNERLQTAAGQQELLNNKLDNAKVAFGAALQPVRALVIQGLTRLVEIATPVVVWMGRVANVIGVTAAEAFQTLRYNVGAVAEAVGRLTGVESLEKWGRTQQDAALKSVAAMEKLQKATTDASLTAPVALGKVAEAHEKVAQSAQKAGEITKAQADAYFDTASKKLGKPLADVIGITTQAIDDLGRAGKERLDPTKAEEFGVKMDALRAATDKGNEALKNIGQSADGARPKVRDVANETATIARSALDAATAFGVLDQKTASALNSAISMGVAIAKLASGAGGAGDVASVIASATNIISQMIGGDAARKRLIADNTAALDRVRKGLDAMSLDVSGETFSKTQAALASVIDVIKGGRGAKNQADVLAALKAQGLGMSDLKKVADELGIKIFSDSGALSVDGLKALFEAMGLVNLGTFGQSYSSQRDATLQGFDITGADALAQIAQLGSLGGQFSQLLAGVVDTQDLTGTRAKLAQLFERMKAGGFTAQQLGGLTSAEFLQFITDLISRIDQVGPTGGVLAPSGGIITAGDITMPGTVVSDTQNAAALSVATLLSEANAFASRTADAVEDSAKSLRSIDGKMDAVLDVLAGGMGAIDASLARANRMASLEAGTVPVLR